MLSTFGDYLKHLRKRAGMTQHDLAAATGYSRSYISALEQNARLPDLETLLQTYVPALGLQEEPHLAAHLVELAALARGERPPSSFTRTHVQQAASTHASNVEEREYRLPLLPTEILGREREINHLCRRLLGHHGRLLTLVGPPGVGKTRLAQAVGAALQRVYRDGAYFVSLAAVSDPALVAVTLLAALKSRDGSSRPPEVRLMEFLRRKEMLLVLDNFEQIIAAAPLVAALLSECAGVRVLVTSREHLHLRAEQRYRVPPLDLPVAIDLFVQRATAVDHNFVLTQANRPLIEAICRRLDCLPLAIELCAAQVDLLSLSQLLAGLQDRRLALLVSGASDMPPQHRTLRLAIHQSYRLLNEAERRLFRSLGIFAGGFGLSELESVSAWRPQPDEPSLSALLHALIGKSLVCSETLPTGEQRYLLLETIREFALEQMHLHGEEASLRQRHYATCLQLFRTADSHLRRPEAATWLARLEPEQDNVRAALQWAFDEARYEDVAWLLAAVGWFWFVRGNWYENGRWLAHLLPHRQALANELRLVMLITVYVFAGSVDEFQPVDRFADEMMELLEVCEHKILHASVWYFVAANLSDFPQAAAAWERAIAFARAASEAPTLGVEFGRLTDHRGILATLLIWYADRLIEHGEVARAKTLASEALALFRMADNPYEIGDCLGVLGRLALLRGDLAQAQGLLREAVSCATAFSYQQVLVDWQPLLGLVTLYNGDAVEARRLLSDSLRLCIELKDKGLLARTCAYLAEAALWEGELDQAREWLAQSLENSADSRGRGIITHQVVRLFVAARLATAQHQYTRAAILFGLTGQAHSRIQAAIAGPIRALADEALAIVREALGAGRFEEAFAMGQQLSLDEAFDTMLAPSPANPLT